LKSDVDFTKEVISRLAEIRNDLSVNKSLYSLTELNEITRLAQEMIATAQFNYENDNYFVA
jgi:hypothetical protein